MANPKLINKVATVENYFKNSIATFRAVDRLPKDVIKIESPSESSSYYTSKDGKTLFRVSNHWAYDECCYIASCVWFLVDNTKNAKGRVRIGKVEFKNIKFYDPNDPIIEMRENRHGNEILDYIPLKFFRTSKKK